MPIHKKLLIVLLAITLPPLLIVSWFDQHATSRLSEALTDLHQATLAGQAARRLGQVVDDHGLVLDRERRLAELSLWVQAWELEERLKAPARGTPARGRQNEAAAVPPDPMTVLTAPLEAPAGPGVDSVQARYVVFADGTRIDLSSGRATAPRRGPSRPWKEWYERTRGQDGPVWSLGLATMAGRPSALTASMPIRRADGTVLAVTAVDVPVRALLAAVRLPDDHRLGATVLIVEPGRAQEGGGNQTGPRLLAAATPGHDGDARAAPAPPDSLLRDLAGAGGRGVFEKHGYVVAHGPAGGFGPLLVVTMPAGGVAPQPAEAEEVHRRIQQQLAVAGAALALMLGIGVVLSFIGARTITRPVASLVQTARRIAEGDLEARAYVRSGDELEDLAEAFNAMLPKLHDRVRMREALTLAMEVQQKLLPAEAPLIPGIDIAGSSVYCDETGGDYYDFLDLAELGTARVGFAVGDVAGHGIAAALLMATARALLRSRAAQPGNLSQVMTEINEHIAADAHAGRFMTLFYGVIDAERRSMRWVSAGHGPALAYDAAEDAFIELAGSDIPLGVEPHWVFREERQDGWLPGDIIAIGTDGIWETRDPSGSMFGIDALRAVIRANAHRPAAAICDAVATSLTDYRQARIQDDDVTIVIVKWLH
ncbi:MAG: SpoIIE family protein phosphatase [Alphaproteobacteria bacterium]